MTPITTLQDVKKNPYVTEYIRQSDNVLKIQGYTKHGVRHLDLVARRASGIAQNIGLNKRQQELCAIAGYCHDMGNYLSRTYHHYLAAILFHQIFMNDFSPDELGTLLQAIVNHDKFELKLTNAISAVVVLADKSDVHRSRVRKKSLATIKEDIHNRVNYAVTHSNIVVNKKKKAITLYLKIDTNFVPIMEYFEIFTKRMTYCRIAAEYLNYNFELIINKFKLL